MSKQANKRLRRYLGLQVNREPLPAFTDMGGYPLAYLCSDGEWLCPDCVRKESARIDDEVRNPECHDQFRVIGVEPNYEGANMACAHCNAKIDAAYAE
jgi:hypothetical protein